jgi:hypothetical protein
LQVPAEVPEPLLKEMLDMGFERCALHHAA